jgi:DNA-binding CsgD family transcriptional regulator
MRTMEGIGDRRVVEDGVTPPIGRDATIEAFQRRLDQDQPRSVALHGAPGMGTTSLALHLAHLARQAGRPTLRLTALDATASIPFGSLAPLLPPDLPLGPDLDGLRAARRALLDATDGRASVLVVDEAHHLDELSASVLAHLVPDPLTVVLAVRSGHAGASLDPLAHHEAIDRVDLGPLPDDTIARILASTLGGPAAGAPIRAIQRLSAGAPAVAVALARSALDEGSLVVERGVWQQTAPLGLPPGLLDRTLAEAHDGDPADREVLELLALAEPVDLAVIRTIADPDALARLDERGLLDVQTDACGSVVRCARPLLTAAINQRMTQTTRATRAHTLAEALGATGAPREDDLALLGGLRLDAGDVLGRDEALAAAHRAHTVGRLDLAQRLAAAARTASPDDAEAGAFVAELLTLTGRSREAERLLARLRPSGDDELALWAMTRASALFYALEEIDAAHAVLRDALHQLDGSSWQAEVVGLGAVFELFLGRPQRALQITEPYLASDNGREFVEAVTSTVPALTVTGRSETAAALASDGFERRVALGDQPMLSGPGMHLVSRAFALGEAGSLGESLDLCQLVYEEAARQSSRDGMMWARLLEGRALLTQGRLDEAHRSFQESAACSADLDMTCHQRWGRAGALLALAQQGRVRETLAAEATLTASRPSAMRLMGSEVTRALAWVHVVVGDLPAARTILLAAADEAAANGERGMELLVLHDLTRLGLGDTADRLATVAAGVEGPLAAARAQHTMGLAATDTDQLEAAGEAFATLTAWLLAAEAISHASTAARATGRIQRSESLARRAEELVTHCRGADTPGLRRTDGLQDLTTREREVATLASRGLRSKEIAAELQVSVRTVDNLLQRAYRKLGITSRADLRTLLGP